MTGGPAPDLGSLRLRRPGRQGRLLVSVAVATVVVLAGVGVYDFVAAEFGGPTLIIYTYPSLFGGTCGSPVFPSVFGAFANAHGVKIEVECPTGTLYNTLLAQANAPAADLVIGLDELTTPEAEAQHLLLPYAPPALANVSPQLVAELSPDDAAVPYEYGYLAIDYASAFSNATGGAVAHLTLPEVDANASWARTFLVEDPTLDITGQEFLVWQIEYYAHVLHKNWTTFWTGAPSASPPVSDSWGDAFSYFLDGVDQMVVSYSTDPAYAAYNGGEGSFNATGTWWNGTEYAWRTIYGIGIVAGSRHRALDQEFEQWFLSGAVQSQIPTTEWEYPANQSVVIPPSADFSYAIPTGSLVPLNNFTTPAEVGSSLLGWVNTWYDLTVGHG